MDNKNYVLAIALSLMIFVGWQYLYLGPKMERERLAAEQQAAEVVAREAGPNMPSGAPVPDGQAPTPGTEAAPSVPGGALTREEAIARGQRVAIATPTLSGSINLTGGRIDDLRLLDFHETTDPTSPTIVLFSPSGAPNPYYAEFGWTQAAGSAASLPTAATVWSVSGNDRLT
ncbi:MAG: membrane protein insertase YidC, partial [Hyphomicrobiaceae bacterium]|nr:membrane protein insertase YidC [Hyphomicrobiaceae bacterium]